MSGTSSIVAPLDAPASENTDQGHAPADTTALSLYRSHGAMVYARCRQMLRDGAAAEDATQEVFVRAHVAFGHRGPVNATAWLYTVATNVCLTELRRLRRPTEVVALEDCALNNSEARDLVLRLLMNVPEDVALTAWLCHVDGMTQDETAEALGVSRRTVCARLERFQERSERFLRGK
jgi:RNA polymerase sigma factor (sigma-70 family)